MAMLVGTNKRLTVRPPGAFDTSETDKPKYRRVTVRPTGAFKLLTYLLYGNYSFLESMPRNVIKLHSIRSMAKFLGVESRKINAWLIYLEGQGFISEVLWSVNKRQVTLKLEGPRNVRK